MFEIVELKTDDEIRSAYQVVNAHYTGLTEPDFMDFAHEMIKKEYRLVAVYSGDEM